LVCSTLFASMNSRTFWFSNQITVCLTKNKSFFWNFHFRFCSLFLTFNIFSIQGYHKKLINYLFHDVSGSLTTRLQVLQFFNCNFQSFRHFVGKAWILLYLPPIEVCLGNNFQYIANLEGQTSLLTWD
jgi:hypothetical protein